MVEAVLWGIIGVIALVGLVLGVAGALQMGHSHYREH